MSDNIAPHIEEDAELYALGALSADECRAVERHLASCAVCRTRVGEAEETIFNLSLEVREVTPPIELDRRMSEAFTHREPARWWIAVAAAFVIGLLPSIPLTIERAAQQQVNGQRDAADVALLNSHFAHAQFTAVGSATLPSAKVLFARNRDWLRVVVQGTQGYSVEGVMANGATVPLGSTALAGSVTQLFVPHAPRGINHVLLRSDGTTVGTALVLSPATVEPTPH